MTHQGVASELDFKIVYRTEGGPALGEGVPERLFILTVDGASGTASFERNRSADEGEGGPIGRFRALIAPDMLNHIATLAARTQWDGLPQASGGGPGVSSISLAYTVGKKSYKHQFTNRDMASLEALDQLLFALNSTLPNVLSGPVEALQLTVARKDRSRFELTYTNVGTESIYVRDPRFNKMDGVDVWSGVRIAHYPETMPGTTEPALEWRQIFVESSDAGSNTPNIRLEPGQSFSLQTKEWTGQQTGERYLVQGIHSDYGGSTELSGCYQIRGLAHSPPIEIRAD